MHVGHAVVIADDRAAFAQAGLVMVPKRHAPAVRLRVVRQLMRPPDRAAHLELESRSSEVRLEDRELESLIDGRDLGVDLGLSRAAVEIDVAPVECRARVLFRSVPEPELQLSRRTFGHGDAHGHGVALRLFRPRRHADDLKDLEPRQAMLRPHDLPGLESRAGLERDLTPHDVLADVLQSVD